MTPQKHNKAVGRILKACRLRKGVSLDQTSGALKHTSPKSLTSFESGENSPKGFQLYELILFYQDVMTQEEHLFFKIAPDYLNQTLSKEFQDKYLHDDC